MYFPRIDGSTSLLRLALLVDEAWPEAADERHAIDSAIARHAAGDRAQAAADRFADDVGRRLADLADDLARADAALDGVSHG